MKFDREPKSYDFLTGPFYLKIKLKLNIYTIISNK